MNETLAKTLDKIRQKIVLGLKLTEREYALWVLYGSDVHTRQSV